MADCEGAAHLVSIPDGVFFSPLQRLQRDLTVEVLKQYVIEKDSGISILDALAGCGVRAIRYALEVPSVQLVVANDLNRSAAEALQQNVDASLSAAAATSCPIQVRCGDAGLLMKTSPAAFDVIELDPCGSPAPYLAAAVRAVKDGGLLCLACTDYQDLVSKRNGEAAQRSFARYSGWVGSSDCTSSAFATEVAIRIVLHSIELAAGAQGRRVEVILCTALDFYLRVIVRIVQDELSPRKPPILVSKSFNENRQFTGDYRSLSFGQVIDGGSFISGGELLGPMWSNDICNLLFLEGIHQRLFSNHNSNETAERNVQTILGNSSHSWFIRKDAFIDTNEYSSPLNSEDDRSAHLQRLRDQCMHIGRARAVDLERESVRQIITQLIEEASVGFNRTTSSILFPFSIREICAACFPSLGTPSSQVLHTMTHLSAQGFEVSRCHSDLLSVKTTASFEDVIAAFSNCHRSGPASMVLSSRGDLAEARISNDVASSHEEAHASLNSTQKKQKVLHLSEGDFELLSTRTGGVGLIDGEDQSKIGANLSTLSHRAVGGRTIRVDKLMSTSDADELHFKTLEEAMQFVQPYDEIVLSSGRHDTPSGGLLLRIPDLHISGELDSYILLAEHSGKAAANAEAATSGSTITVLAARVILTGITVEATPNAHQVKKNGYKSGGAPSWSGLAVEGLGSSAILRNCRICVKKSVSKDTELGSGKGSGKGAYSRGGHNVKGAGIVVASRSLLTIWNVSIDHQDHPAGFDIGILVCGRAEASIFDSLIRNTGSCCLLIQSGGQAFGANCKISNSLSGAAASGLGSALVLIHCMIESCERVLVEASNRARLDLQHCQIGSKLHIHGNSIGKINGGCDGGGILVRHSGTTASILNCLVSSTRLAAVDVRNSARLVLTHTILSRGRTSGLYVSEGAAVSLGAGCTILNMRIAALELEADAQVVCESTLIVQRIRAMIEGAEGSNYDHIDLKEYSDDQEKSVSFIVMSCSVPIMVGSGAAFAFLEV